MAKCQFQGQEIEIKICFLKKLGSCVIPHFHGILHGKSIYGIMFVIQGDLQDQEVNLKKLKKKLTSTNCSKCNTVLFSDFKWRIHLWNCYRDPRELAK